MPPKGKGNGKKKGKGKGKGKGASKETKCRAAAESEPTSHFHFPREIISNILSRLPVKTLLRFRCVSKQWRNLISKPNFIASHFRHSSSLQLSGSSILIGSRHHESNHHVVSLYNPPESVVQVDSPFPCFFPNMYIVGPCHGFICLFNPPWGELITLWNPSMRKYKMVELTDSLPSPGLHFLTSIGMAFDYQHNELLILRIFCVGIMFEVPNHVEVYSSKSGKWKKLKNEMIFHIVEFTCNVIVKGVAYWLVCMPDKFGSRAVFVRFDVGKLVFEKLPSIGRRKKHQYLVELEGSLCMLDWDHKDDCHMDVWVMDDVDGWSKKYSVGPLVGFDRILGCLRNGDIVVKNENGVIFICDPITNSVKENFSIDNSKDESYVVVDYSESLFLIGGMLPVKKQDAQDKLARKKVTRHSRDLAH
nr:F-box/kelch-repeat protein At3g23880-like [Solanum lycopersicum]